MFNTLPANPYPPSSEQIGAGGGSAYVLPTASADTLGGVKVGNNLSIADGVLSASAYVLPTASADTLGGVKVGNNLSIADGVLSAPAPYTPPAYSTTEVDTGAKWIDDNKIYRKVINFQSDLTVSNSSWTSTSEAIVDIGTLISAQGVYDDACYPLMCSFDSSGVLSVLACRASSSVDVKKIIVEYTKTPASE